MYTLRWLDRGRQRLLLLVGDHNDGDKPMGHT